jgi:hypothetical protein
VDRARVPSDRAESRRDDSKEVECAPRTCSLG